MGEKWKKAKSVARNIDLLGNRVEFLIGGSSSYKTYMGSLLTLLVGGVLIYYSSLTVQKVFDRTNPTRAFQTEYDRENSQTDFRENQLLPFFGLLSRTNLSYDLSFERFSNVRATIYKAVFDVQKNEIVRKFITLNVKQCSKLVNKKPYEFFFNSADHAYLIPFSQCIEWPEDFDEPIKGDYTMKHFANLKLEFFPCNLTASCASVNELIATKFWYGHTKPYVRYSDFDDPIKRVAYSKGEISFQQFVGVTMFNFVKETKVVDETNYLQPSHEAKTYSEVGREETTIYQRFGEITCTSAEVVAGSCRPYLTIFFNHMGVTDTITRTYADLQTAVGDIGGFLEIILFAAAIVYTFYNQRYMDRFLVGKLIPRKNIESLAREKATMEVISAHFGKKLGGNMIDSLTPHEKTMLGSPIARTKQIARKIVSPNLLSNHQTDNILDQTPDKESPQIGKKDLDHFEGLAKEHIEGLTEITTIVRELSSWQVFKDIVLQDYQRRLLPVVEIEASKRRRDAEQARKKRSNMGAVSNNQALQRVVDVMADTMDMRTALDKLKTNIEKSIEIPPDNWEDGLRSKIDQFILDSLPNFDTSGERDKKSSGGSDPFGSSHERLSNAERVSMKRPRNEGEHISELNPTQNVNSISGSPLPISGNHDISISRLPMRKVDRQ